MKNPIPLIFVLALAEIGFGQTTGNPPLPIYGQGYLGSLGPQQLAVLADQGNLGAQANLGSMYAEGRGVAQDYVQAYKWLHLAITGAVDDRVPYRQSQTAVDARKAIAGKMTPQQVDEAEQLAKEWEEEYEKRIGNGPYRMGWGVVPPRDVYRPVPSYTDQARKARISGIIVVELVVRKDGTVGTCRIVRGLGYGLDESAIQTMTSRWRFQPGTYRGKPVDVIAMAEVVFKLY
jgi:TonB family protein